MDTILKTCEASLKAAVGATREELSGIRAGRLTAGLLDDIAVPYLEGSYPLKQLASFSLNPPREIVVSPWDKTSLPAVASALEAHGAGLSVAADGAVVRVRLPELSVERREELIKFSKAVSEKGKIRIRNEREGANKTVEAAFKAKTLTEDQKFNAKKKIQDQVDRANNELDTELEKKVKELQQ